MKIAQKITVVALLWLIFVNPGTITSIDTVRRLSMSHAWWTGEEEGFSGNKIIININGKNYIPYDLGQSMLMLPGDWLGEKLGQGLKNEKEREHFREAIVGFLIFVPINLLMVLTCLRFLQLLNYREKVAGLSSIVLLIGTSVLFYSSFHQQNNQILLFVLVSYQMALAYAIKGKKSLAILSGAALGFAFIIRITSILYIASLLTFLIGCVVSRDKINPLSSGLRSFLLWMSGFMPMVLLERALNYVRYGSWSATTVSLHLQVYANAPALVELDAVVEGANTGFSFFKLLTKVQPEALFAPFFSPEKSIFLYDPLVLPCFILLIVCWKFLAQDIKWYAIATTIGFLLHLYLYSWTSEWILHAEWGARYHITSVHLWLVPLIPLLVRGAIKQIDRSKNLERKTLTWSARVIIIVAIAIQLSSITLDGAVEAYQQRLGIGSSLRIAQRFKNISYLLGGSSPSDFDFLQVEVPPETAILQKKIEAKTGWNILPFLYQNKLDSDSWLNKLIPLLTVVWSLIFILAVTSTVWIFIK